MCSFKNDLIKLMCDIFKVTEIKIDTIEYGKHFSWDSLTHVVLIAQIEKKFNIRFAPEEIVQMINFTTVLNFTKDAILNSSQSEK